MPVSRRKFVQMPAIAAAATAGSGVVAGGGTASAATTVAVPVSERAARGSGRSATAGGAPVA